MENVHLITALLAGLLSFVSPCVLPLVPAYISFISGVSMDEFREGIESKKSFKKVALSSIFFIFGFSLVFILLGASATAIGKLLLSKFSFFTQIAGIVI